MGQRDNFGMHGKHSKSHCFKAEGKLVLTFQHEISCFPGSPDPPDYHRIEVEIVTSWTHKMIFMLVYFALESRSRDVWVVGITRDSEDFNVTPFSQLARL